MFSLGVPTVSIVLQLIAAGLALNLIRMTGWRFAWSLVSAALVLTSIRSGATLYAALAGEETLSPDLTAEGITLVVSVLMVAGVALIGHQFVNAKRVERILPRRESELRRLNEELANRVEERDTELRVTRETLARNQSLAALGEMTGSVVHDLRNPLGAIEISFDVIRIKCEAAKVDVDRAIGRVQRNIRRCDNLIGELLDLTRVEELHAKPTVLDVWLSEILDEQFVPNSITIDRELRAGAAAVDFDREQIRRAVINLLENACQAMVVDENGDGAASRKQLTVSTRRLPGRIEIEIADTGRGIPKDDLSKVLEPLFSTKEVGTGLGLASVQRIMARHNGGVEIASTLQRGTQVRLWLPLDQGVELRISA